MGAVGQATGGFEEGAGPIEPRTGQQFTPAEQSSAVGASDGERKSDEDPENAALDPAPVAAEPAAVQAVVAKLACKAGKQPVAPGIGQTQGFQAHDEQPH